MSIGILHNPIALWATETKTCIRETRTACCTNGRLSSPFSGNHQRTDIRTQEEDIRQALAFAAATLDSTIDLHIDAA